MLHRAASDRSQLRWRLSVSTALVAHLTAALALGSLEDPELAAKATPEPILVVVALDDSGSSGSRSAEAPADPAGTPAADKPAAEDPKGGAPAPPTEQPAPRPRPEPRAVLAAAEKAPEVDTPRATASDRSDAQPERLDPSTAEMPDEGGDGALGVGRLATGGSGSDDAVAFGMKRQGAGGANGAPGAIGGGESPSPAKLLLQSARCNDLFPHGAMTDRGRVTLEVGVAPDGTARHARVLAAMPAAEGFAPAARHCVKRLRFSPARDAVGHAVASLARVRLGFRRN